MKYSKAECPNCKGIFNFVRHKSDIYLVCPYCKTESVLLKKDKSRSWSGKNKFLTSRSMVSLFIFFVLLTSFEAYRMTIYNEDYCCRHMARDFEDILEKTDIDVTLVRGTSIFTEKGHMWIKIGFLEIDSVTLLPFPMSIFYKDIREFIDYDEYVDRNKYMVMQNGSQV